MQRGSNLVSSGFCVNVDRFTVLVLAIVCLDEYLIPCRFYDGPLHYFFSLAGANGGMYIVKLKFHLLIFNLGRRTMHASILTCSIFILRIVGKTTFTKLLTGELQPNTGEIEIGETVVLGVYDQLGLKFDEMAEKQTVLEYVIDQIQNNDSKSMDGVMSEARTLLSQFQFERSRWQERISVLSGGERRRLQILSVLSVVSC